MASLSRNAQTGLHILQVVCDDGKRRSIRLGVNRAVAGKVRDRVTEMEECRDYNVPFPPALADWLDAVADDVHAGLVKAGLAEPRAVRRLAEFLGQFLARHAGERKQGTVANTARVVADLTACLGDVALRDVDGELAESLKTRYVAKGYADATTARRVRTARTIFAEAVRLGLIARNPFAGVKCRSKTNYAADKAYVTPEDTERVLAACNPTWRVMVALSRFGGLRCPSEVLSLRWEHVDLTGGRMTVLSPKTEYLKGKDRRACPVFARLRPYLEEARREAAAGETYVVGGPLGAKYRAASKDGEVWKSVNLRSNLLKILKRAGVAPWASLWNSMRSSLITDLSQDGHPIQVITAWVGNSPDVALSNYLQVMERDFEKAAGPDRQCSA
jgi:integrase